MIRRTPLALALLAALGLGASSCALFAGKPKPRPKAAAKAVTEADRRQAQDLYIKGVYAYAEGRTEEAIGFWNRCLKLDPRHPKARESRREAKAKLEAVKHLR